MYMCVCLDVCVCAGVHVCACVSICMSTHPCSCCHLPQNNLPTSTHPLINIGTHTLVSLHTMASTPTLHSSLPHTPWSSKCTTIGTRDTPSPQGWGGTPQRHQWGYTWGGYQWEYTWGGYQWGYTWGGEWYCYFCCRWCGRRGWWPCWHCYCYPCSATRCGGAQAS